MAPVSRESSGAGSEPFFLDLFTGATVDKRFRFVRHYGGRTTATEEWGDLSDMLDSLQDHLESDEPDGERVLYYVLTVEPA